MTAAQVEAVARRPEVAVPTWLVPPVAVEAWRLLCEALEGLSVAPPCAADPEAWFVSPQSALLEEVAARCRACAVVVECAAYGLAAREPHGVWGGTTPAERRASGRRVAS